MSQHSISEAAKLVNKDRKTLTRMIQAGKLSSSKSPSGMPQLETSELIRVFGEIRLDVPDGSRVEVGQNPHDVPSDIATKLALAEAEIRHLNLRLAEKDTHIEDMRQSVRLLEHSSKPKSWKFWG